MEKTSKPTKGQSYEIEIESMTHEGEGVGRIGNMAVFVEGALPGERVRAKIAKISKRYAVAKLEEVIRESSERVKPQCPHFDRCGGCSLLHLDYGGQLKFKTQKVKDALERIGNINTKVFDTLGMSEPWRYRNKSQFPVGVNNETIVTGFYVKRSHSIVASDSCLIQHEASDDIIKVVKEWMICHGVTAYDERTQEGLVRHVLIRVSRDTGQAMVILIINGRGVPKASYLVGKLREEIPNFTCLALNVNTKNTNVIMGKEIISIYGEPYIHDSIGDIVFRLSPKSFFQVNSFQVEVLYEKTLEFAGLKGEEVVIDAYCGIGSITLFLAKRAKKVYGIEVVPEAVRDARHNATINGIKNVEFLEGRAEDLMPLLSSQGVKADVVVVDPPRKGCDKTLLDSIAQMKPKTVVYVSCNPSTLARDLKYLESTDYKTEKAQPVDMFPHTGHVECVVLMAHCSSEEK